MKKDRRGFIIFDSKKEETEWMREWIAKNPGPWQRCPTCLSYYQSKNKPRPGHRCAQCPNQEKRDTHMPQRKPGFPTQHVRGSRDRRDWANYH